MERIDLAAIREDGGVYSVPRPGRHHDIIRAIATAWPKRRPVRGEQGFLTTTGRFVCRKEAARIAIEAGQIDRLRWPPNLYSEDLW